MHQLDNKTLYHIHSSGDSAAKSLCHTALTIRLEQKYEIRKGSKGSKGSVSSSLQLVVNNCRSQPPVNELQQRLHEFNLL